MTVPITPTKDELIMAASRSAVWNASPKFWIRPPSPFKLTSISPMITPMSPLARPMRSPANM